MGFDQIFPLTRGNPLIYDAIIKLPKWIRRIWCFFLGHDIPSDYLCQICYEANSINMNWYNNYKMMTIPDFFFTRYIKLKYGLV